MQAFRLVAILILTLSAQVFGQADARFTNITVFLPDDDPVSFNGQWILLPRGEYTYRLHTPADTSRRYPCLFVLSDGRGGGIADAAAASMGSRWVIVDIPVTTEDGAVRAAAGFICAHDDSMRRAPIQPGLKFTAGDGENSARALTIAGMRSGFCGAICMKRVPDDSMDRKAFGMNTNFLLYCAEGETNDVLARGMAWMEDRVLLSWPYEDSLKDYYVSEFARWADEADAADGDRQKMLMEKVRLLAERRELASEPRIRTRIERLERVLLER